VKEYFRSGTKWEPFVGYCRAVKIGNNIYVSGTTATNEQGQIIGIGNPYLQTKQVIQNIEKALLALKSSLNDVVRTRIYVTNIDQWEEVGKAHGEYFRGIDPASTMVEVSNLIDPEMLVEIEAEAVVFK
jgi:enamine deaminase RidA (YjgF/YER057c/UK114 family)